MEVWTAQVSISVWKLVVFFLANLGVISGLYIHWTRIHAQRQHWIASFINVERIFKALWLAKKMGDEPFLLVHRYFIIADDYEVFSDSHRDGTLLQVEEKSKYHPIGY